MVHCDSILVLMFSLSTQHGGYKTVLSKCTSFTAQFKVNNAASPVYITIIFSHPTMSHACWMQPYSEPGFLKKALQGRHLPFECT